MFRQQRAANRPPTSNVNLMDTEEGVKEEDVMIIQECAHPTTQSKLTTELAQHPKNSTSCCTPTTRQANATYLPLTYNTIMDKRAVSVASSFAIVRFFYSGYCMKLISPQSTLKLHQHYLLVKNYEGFTADKQAKVQRTLYIIARAYLEISKNNAEETQAKKSESNI